MPCNWAQIHEGQIDSAHSSSLHSSDMVPARVTRAEADDKSWYRPSTDKSPRMQIERTSYGLHYVAIRRPVKNAATHNYLRVTEFVAPYYSLIPPNNRHRVASVIVPIDDMNSVFYFIAWDGPDVPTTEEWRTFHRTRRGIDLTDDWAPQGTLEQQVPAGSRGDEGRQLHRHRGHPEPGCRHVGLARPDRRPHERHPGSVRPRRGRIPQA